MKTLIPTAIRYLLMFTAVAALSLAYPASVHAVPTTYKYTGNPFTDVTDPPYTTSDFVTGMVTLAGPLAPNMPLTTISPTAFTFSDGVQTLTNLTPFTLFQFATGSTGAITQWNIVLASQLDHIIVTRNAPGDVEDGGRFSLFVFGNNANSAGTWAISASVADTGSTLSLMTLTLMALGLVARRFQRAAG
jgi:hypothetical protein